MANKLKVDKQLFFLIPKNSSRYKKNPVTSNATVKIAITFSGIMNI